MSQEAKSHIYSEEPVFFLFFPLPYLFRHFPSLPHIPRKTRKTQAHVPHPNEELLWTASKITRLTGPEEKSGPCPLSHDANTCDRAIAVGLSLVNLPLGFPGNFPLGLGSLVPDSRSLYLSG